MSARAPGWRIAPFDRESPELRAEAARLLFDGFREHWPDAWPTLEAAAAEVEEALGEEKVVLAALTEDGALLGWCGIQPQYGGNVWEIHPLVVVEHARGRGIARSLVLGVEEEARLRGGLTLWVGTDDEAGLTSLGGIDLYPDLLGKLAAIRNLSGHPMGFYLALGFKLAGVVPDANGFGKPDLLMAKRIGRKSQD